MEFNTLIDRKAETDRITDALHRDDMAFSRLLYLKIFDLAILTFSKSISRQPQQHLRHC